jgi:hypothetical protein
MQLSSTGGLQVCPGSHGKGIKNGFGIDFDLRSGKFRNLLGHMPTHKKDQVPLTKNQ